MIKPISVAAISICIAACASSGPEAPPPAATAATAPEAAAPSVAANAVSASDSTPTAGGGIQELDAPDVPMTATVSTESQGNEMVCRRERETGTKFSRKVCRSRAEIEARESKDQDKMREMRKINTGSHKDINN